MLNDKKNGKIITFYSYKGGTGRTMSLANMAVLLARHDAGKKVLMLDWDLEAPGLHVFLGKYLDEQELKNNPGIINLFLEARKRFPEIVSEGKETVEQIRSTLDNFFERALLKINGWEHLQFMKAGLFDEQYSHSVRDFDWQEFFEHRYFFFPVLIEYLQENYDFILVDSRTGLTDMGGICTMLLPEGLVAVFTPSDQALEVTKICEKAANYRRGSDDLRPLVIYPLPRGSIRVSKYRILNGE